MKLKSNLYSWKATYGRMLEDGLSKLKSVHEDIQACKLVESDIYYQESENAQLVK
jgi:hypothetical protein